VAGLEPPFHPENGGNGIHGVTSHTRELFIATAVGTCSAAAHTEPIGKRKGRVAMLNGKLRVWGVQAELDTPPVLVLNRTNKA
jgi:hypothetical protein